MIIIKQLEDIRLRSGPDLTVSPPHSTKNSRSGKKNLDWKQEQKFLTK